ncbi:MAG: acetamidase/formamidase family protein [Chloroflexota bacterium]|nr:acetamidase/formamidase family protein [Chloroflexota bacterium]
MTIHQFQPDHYLSTIGSHQPVLRIADGDSVMTTTVDANGWDEHGEKVAAGGNPMTGPFYVEGAEPGDALAVTIVRMTPNRVDGWTRSSLATTVIEPHRVPDLPESSRAIWAIDRPTSTVRLQAPPARLADFVLPLAPMIGCFGVAPAGGQAISTATSGQHGGNMDYRGFGPGVTAYFPVAVAGALFHLGDGHATQGCGEIVGTGVETSFEIEFTVNVRQGWPIAWPRGENETDLFALGNARPLDQALQHATTEMLDWMTADYGFDPLTASHVLGQTVRYDVGNVFNPAYTMVCRLAKHWLA